MAFFRARCAISRLAAGAVKTGAVFRSGLADRACIGGSAVKATRLPAARLLSSAKPMAPIVMVRDALASGEKVPLLAERLEEGDPGVVTMYVCGPTVYDSAHLGHARTYVQFDMIRRVLRDVFRYEVAFFMNVTDVDDKILARAGESGQDWRQLATRFEHEFFQDMMELGVEEPTFAPRATDYISEIVDHIAELQDRGLAYQGESTGSIYFDLNKFDNNENVTQTQKYGALDSSRRLSNVGQASVSTQGQDLDKADATSGHILSDKRDPRDFALWKVVRGDDEDNDLGNVFWTTPWGNGRPGWHAECAAMVACTAGTVRGDGKLDIHGGGVDLKFPHHENERAQGQGALCCRPGSDANAGNWSSHFLHTGHLYIKGLKMSKSLKNFITVRQLLGKCDSEPLDGKVARLTPRQLRLMFLSHKYSDRMDLSRDSMVETERLDTYFLEFFLHVERTLGDSISTRREGKWHPIEDNQAIQCIDRCETQVFRALADDFDSPAALRAVQELVSFFNTYSRTSEFKPGVLFSAAVRVDRTLQVLGFGGTSSSIPGYWASASSNGVGKIPSTGSDSDESLSHVVKVLAEFRTRVRLAALSGDTKDVLDACDDLRDSRLPALGLRIDDLEASKGADPSSGKPSSIGQKQRAGARARFESADELFGHETNKYSLFDESGVPTHDLDGLPLSKNARKKLIKQMRIHQKKLERAK